MEIDILLRLNHTSSECFVTLLDGWSVFEATMMYRAVGITLMSYMNRNVSTGDLDFEDPTNRIPEWRNVALGRDSDAEESELSDESPEQGGYSPQLRDLVTRCVQYRQAARISFPELRDEILRFTGGMEGGADLAEGVRTSRRARDARRYALLTNKET